MHAWLSLRVKAHLCVDYAVESLSRLAPMPLGVNVRLPDFSMIHSTRFRVVARVAGGGCDHSNGMPDVASW